MVVLASAITFVAAYKPPHPFEHPPFVADSAFGAVAPIVELDSSAFGLSGAVHLHLALPGQQVEIPFDVSGPATRLGYRWERVSDSSLIDSARVFAGDTLVAPSVPGLYQLTLVRDSIEQVVDGLTLAVLVPFAQKKGPVIDGYRIGTYLAEHRRSVRLDSAAAEHPEGFVRVLPNESDLPVTAHLRWSDLITHDGQESWPRYVAVNPRMLDKLELVVERVARQLGGTHVDVLLDVHSGFRTPAYNRHVPQAARDSRHQYGDAVDVAIDANGDGRMDASDARRVAAVVDSVETEYPELTGGVGLYTSRRYRHPYVHIDARGTRVRWRG
jgi:hypothetical protein